MGGEGLVYVTAWLVRNRMGVVYQHLLQRLPILAVAIVLLLLFCLGDIEKCFSVPRDCLAMMDTKDPSRLIVIVIVAEPTFLKAFLK